MDRDAERRRLFEESQSLISLASENENGEVH